MFGDRTRANVYHVSAAVVLGDGVVPLPIHHLAHVSALYSVPAVPADGSGCVVGRTAEWEMQGYHRRQNENPRSKRM